MPATQQTFDRALKDPKHRPTLGLDGAKHLLDLNEDYILDLCADRALSHAWNIGLGPDRREVRILRASLDHYIAHGSSPFPLSDAEVFALLLPPTFRTPQSELRNPHSALAPLRTPQSELRTLKTPKGFHNTAQGRTAPPSRGPTLGSASRIHSNPEGVASVRPYLTNGELQRALNCVSGHILHLIQAKALKLQPKTTYTRGPNGAALVTVASFHRFLQLRRL